MSPRAAARQPHAVLDLASRRLKAAKIERLLDLGARAGRLALLEIGTGSGGIAHYFATHDSLLCDVVAVDVVDQRKLHEGYVFHQVEDTCLPFPDASFDVVITNHVIEHVGGLDAQLHHLSEVHRVMREDAIAYLAVPNRWMLVEPHFKLAFLSWLPRALRSPYVRLMRRGSHYDCEPLPLRTLESLLGRACFTYQNLCVRALRETLTLEGGQGFVATLAAQLPDAVLDRLSPIIPTLIYRLARDPKRE